MSAPSWKVYAERQHSFNSEQWVEMYSHRDTSGKATFQLEDESASDEEDEGKEYSKWSELPDLALEKIFSYLSIRGKYYASLVCRSWYRAFYLPYTWSHFVLADTTLTRGRFNYYSGWQYVLDHVRTQMCLSQVGRNFRYLTFEPMLNFYNLYEFMNMVSWYAEQKKDTDQFDTRIGKQIESLKFTFPCDMSTREEPDRIRLFGTGGKLLDALKRLMENLPNLRRLELIDLMLDPQEAQHLLDGVCEKRYLSLHTLILVNTTRIMYQILHVGVFLNLRVLVISPQNLGNELVELLGFTKLQHMHIVQNSYTVDGASIKSVSEKSWRCCSKNNPKLRVHLEMETLDNKQLTWQHMAPVRSIIYDTPKTCLSTEAMISAIDFYGKHLRVHGCKNLPRFYRAKSFHERIDGALMLLSRQCPQLRLLIITERISTATILLIAHTAKNLQQLHVRRNAVIKKCDWPKSPEWSEDFFTWLKTSSQSYELTEQEVSQILGRNWRMINDKDFKHLSVNLHDEGIWD